MTSLKFATVQRYDIVLTAFNKRYTLKCYTSQILSYKILSFCEQILKIGANDASGIILQYALYTGVKIYIFEEITGIRSWVLSIFIKNNIVVLGDFN
jgi:hypothetical protein